MNTLVQQWQEAPYEAYSYSYPHKTAYRRLEPPQRLASAWQTEPRHALFLYLHIPFCEHRCGFCNLFTHARPAAELPDLYLDQLAIEAKTVRAAIPDATFARLAIGGGTPTYLTIDQWRRLFDLIHYVMGADPRRMPMSVEASPSTIDEEKLSLLRSFGVDRLSLGVQTFDDHEAGKLGRPQRRLDVERALETIRKVGFPHLNLDLIYGGAAQTAESWRSSLQSALIWRPEEIYLYPLYVRPLTGLGERDSRQAGSSSHQKQWSQQRLAAYRQGRSFLLEHGYEQVSMRMFRRADVIDADAPIYCCQADGMVGLGCGARSYTRRLHYCTEFAVDRAGVWSILQNYLDRPPEAFRRAHHGFVLDEEDRRRRFVILSLLQSEGLDRRFYQQTFAADVLDHLPQLHHLAAHELAKFTADRIRLTPAGLEKNDAIGPWLYSDKVRRLMQTNP